MIVEPEKIFAVGRGCGKTETLVKMNKHLLFRWEINERKLVTRFKKQKTKRRFKKLIKKHHLEGFWF